MRRFRVLTSEPGPLADQDESDRYFIEKLIDHRVVKRRGRKWKSKVQYLVKWRNSRAINYKYITSKATFRRRSFFFNDVKEFYDL